MSLVRLTTRSLPVMLLVATMIPRGAFATLGGDMASVEADQQALNTSQQITANNAAYTVYELQTATGTKIREYVSTPGTVFAVAWDGPALPDFRRLFGDYFSKYTETAAAQRAGHGHLVVRLPELIVESSGHMRAFFGRAYLPKALPPGLALSEIR
jgi:hypothetical protein